MRGFIYGGVLKRFCGIWKNVLIYFLLTVLFNLTTIQQKRLKVKPICPNVRSRTTWRIWNSSSGKFYVTAKRHKLKNDISIGDLSFIPIISNVVTASYQLAKYLGKLLSPLNKPQYMVKSNKEFVKVAKNNVFWCLISIYYGSLGLLNWYNTETNLWR